MREKQDDLNPLKSQKNTKNLRLHLPVFFLFHKKRNKN